jgi:eukaryotic-like serine/threonine-protein kinase
MGIVYEAVQESLGRHVALKVLPTPGVLSGNHLERFRREARAAAKLHHTNIVPVFGVGEHQGVHYYAMQFIQGQSLDRVLHELKRQRAGLAAPEPEDVKFAGDLTATIAVGMMSGEVPASVEEVECQQEPSFGSATPSSEARAAPSTLTGKSERTGKTEKQYYHSVARVGMQVAEALAHAHQQGILHRDIKPANLLLDAQGNPWITDFGLAKSEGTDELTGHGDIVGTLRYMAPERFSGKADGRSDIYSLGLTLYEMLSLRPTFDESDRQRLIRQIMEVEPLRPRKVIPHIPRDLEAILLKTIAKKPEDRYATAQELADDLGRFLQDEPILAKRPTWVRHVQKWTRRHLAAVLTGVIIFVVAVAVLGGVTGWFLQQGAKSP